MIRARAHKKWGRVGSPHSPVRRKHCRRIAPLGGEATFRKYGRKYMRRIGKAGSFGRWSYARSPLRNPFI